MIRKIVSNILTRELASRADDPLGPFGGGSAAVGPMSDPGMNGAAALLAADDRNLESKWLRRMSECGGGGPPMPMAEGLMPDEDEEVLVAGAGVVVVVEAAGLEAVVVRAPGRDPAGPSSGLDQLDVLDAGVGVRPGVREPLLRLLKLLLKKGKKKRHVNMQIPLLKKRCLILEYTVNGERIQF